MHIAIALVIYSAAALVLPLPDWWDLWPYGHFGDAWENIRNGYLMASGWTLYSDIPFVHTPGIPSVLSIAFTLSGIAFRNSNQQLAELLEVVSILVICSIQICILSRLSMIASGLYRLPRDLLFASVCIPFILISLSFRLYLPLSESLVGLICLLSFVKLLEISVCIDDSTFSPEKDNAEFARRLFTDYLLLFLYCCISVSIGKTNFLGQAVIMSGGILLAASKSKNLISLWTSSFQITWLQPLSFPILVLISLNIRSDPFAMIYWLKYYSQTSSLSLPVAFIENMNKVVTFSSAIPFDTIYYAIPIGIASTALLNLKGRSTHLLLVVIYNLLFICDNWRIAPGFSGQSYKCEFNWILNLFFLMIILLRLIVMDSNNSSSTYLTKYIVPKKEYSLNIKNGLIANQAWIPKDSLKYLLFSIVLILATSQAYLNLAGMIKGVPIYPPTATTANFDAMYSMTRLPKYENIGIKDMNGNGGQFCVANMIWDTKFNIADDVLPCKGIWQADPSAQYFQKGKYSSLLKSKVLSGEAALIYPTSAAKEIENIEVIRKLKEDKLTVTRIADGTVFITRRP
jgi:hypothetical protein